LALGSPASTPGGASASSPGGSVGSRKTDVMGKMLMAQQVSSAKAAEQLTKQQTRKTSAEADEAEFKKMIYNKLEPKLEELIDGALGWFDQNATKGNVQSKLDEFMTQTKESSAKGIKWLEEKYKQLEKEYYDMADRVNKNLLERRYGKPNIIKER